MAHKKGVGSSRNGRDSNPKMLGVKVFGGQAIDAGNIIIRQRGTQFHVGTNVGMGKDHTIYSKIDGVVCFEPMSRNRRRISVYTRHYQMPALVAHKADLIATLPSRCG